MATTTFLIGLGGNRRHGRHGAPAAVLDAALATIARDVGRVRAVSPTIRTRALGPGGRDYANAAALVETALAPEALLGALKAIERGFGRRRGRRWGARVLDLDVLAWSGGDVATRALIVPHPRLHERAFVLGPASVIAGGWRMPGSPLTIRRLAARHSAPRPVDRFRRRP